MNKERIFLFSIDLEDVRLGMPDPNKYKERVLATTEKYLNWLNKFNFKCTFFTVGNIADKYPSLITDIVSEGHEIACHTSAHIPLDKQTKETFKEDLKKNIDSLQQAGAKKITGFRAPIFSLTENTKWAYEVLEELNFSYSSSVLPAKNPLYGWESFGQNPKKTSNIIEIPMTVAKYGPIQVPFGGGIYFRLLPEFMIHSKIKNHHTLNNPLLGYFHPYDIDTEQGYFMHPGINNNIFYNFLMYYNRKNVFNRLEKIINKGFHICTYSDYVENYLSVK